MEDLARYNFHDLCETYGLEQHVVLRILAAFELGKRRKFIQKRKSTPITSSDDVYKMMRPLLYDLPHEEF